MTDILCGFVSESITKPKSSLTPGTHTQIPVPIAIAASKAKNAEVDRFFTPDEIEVRRKKESTIQ